MYQWPYFHLKVFSKQFGNAFCRQKHRGNCHYQWQFFNFLHNIFIIFITIIIFTTMVQSKLIEENNFLFNWSSRSLLYEKFCLFRLSSRKLLIFRHFGWEMYVHARARVCGVWDFVVIHMCMYILQIIYETRIKYQ